MSQHLTQSQTQTRFKSKHLGLTTAMIAMCTMLSSASWAVDVNVKQLRIGYQKSAINLAVAKQQKLLEKEFPNAKITWNEFPAGPQILEALAVGSLDIGVTGDTPPVYAQAANKPLYYFAYEAAKPAASAILVAKNSNLRSLKELRGKRIALQRGSSAHYLFKLCVKQACNGQIFNRFGLLQPKRVRHFKKVLSMLGQFGTLIIPLLCLKIRHAF